MPQTESAQVRYRRPAERTNLEASAARGQNRRHLAHFITASLLCAVLGLAASPAAASAFTISGIVKAQSTGLGVAETKVIVREASNEKQVAATQTAIDGSYTVEAPGGTYNIEYVPPVGSGYGTFQDRAETISGSRTINVLLVPSGSVTFSGKLFGDGGVALANATIRVGNESTATGADGSFSVSVAPGSYPLSVYGARQSGVSPATVPQSFEFAGGEVKLTSSLNENLTLPLHAVTVKTVGPGGSAIPGVSFSGNLSQSYLGEHAVLAPGVTTRYAYTYQAETTNSGGTATLSVADAEATEATIDAVPPKESGVVRTPLNLAKVASDESRELTLTSGVTFSGKLFGDGGVALANATIRVGNESTATGADGSFSVSVAPGSYPLSVYGARQSGVSPATVPQSFEFAGGEVKLTSSLNENLTLPLHAVTVKTVGPGGSAIPGVSFSGNLSQSYLGEHAVLAPGVTTRYAYTYQAETTNSGGTATLSVADAEATEATIDAVPPKESGVVRTPLNLAKVASDESRELTLTSGVTFSGKLFGDGGVALANATIRVGNESTATGADGSFSVSVAPGSYPLSVYGARQSGVSPATVPQSFEFAGGEVKLTSSLNENLTLPLHAVTVKTVGPGGSAIPGVSFSGNLSQSYLGEHAVLAPGVTTRYAYTYQAETTNSGGTATLSVADAEATEATIDAVPPKETELARVPVNLAKVSEDQTRLVAFGKSGTDTTPPEIKCGTPDATWHAENVSIACTAADSGSGLAHPEDASFSLGTSVASGEESASALTGTHRVCDEADNCAEAGPIGSIKVDRKAPLIPITAPVEGATVEQGAVLDAQYSCTDGGSGVATCEGTVPSGSAVSTSTVGQHALSVSSTDGVGNHASKNVTYTVVTSTDTTPPTITCGSPDSAWHAQNVAVACTASDSDGALAHPEDASFTLSTTVAPGESTVSAQTATRQVCDKAGNCAQAGPIGPIKVDRTLPAIAVSQPEEGQVIQQGAAVKANYSCADSGSGVASCEAPVPTGHALDTSVPGQYTLSVGAASVAGGQTSRTVHYTVVVPSECAGSSQLCQTGLGDTEPPHVAALTVTPSTVNTSSVAQAVTVAVETTDNLAGVSAVQVNLANGGRWFTASATLAKGGTRLDGSWTATLTLPANSAVGNYALSVGTIDAVGNAHTYSSKELQALGFPSSVLQEGAGDTVPPEVHGVSATPASVSTCESPQAVSVAVGAGDNASGVASVAVQLTGPSAQQIFAQASLVADGGTALNGHWAATLALPKDAQGGTWRISVLATDLAGNQLYLSAAQLSGLGYTSSVDQTCAGDVTPPKVLGVTLAPTSVDTSGSPRAVTIRVPASDDLSGVASVTATLSSGAQARSVSAVLQSGTPLSGTWGATVTLPRYSQQGTWLLSLAAVDAVGNTLSLSSSEISALGFPSSISQTGEGDSTPPAVTGGSINPGTIDTFQAPAIVHVHVNATDAQSGTAFVGVQFTSPHGQRVSASGVLSSGTAQSGEWIATVKFPRYSEHGGWNLQLELWDAFGNHHTYTSSELSAKGLFAQIGVGPEPEIGRCAKAPSEKVGTKTVYHGGFTASTCVKASGTHTGAYEWEPGVARGHFTTKIKALTKLTLETVKAVKLTCSGETSTGEYSGPKSVGNVVLTLTGCELPSTKAQCESAGAGAGEVVSQSLEGVLGIDALGTTYATNKIGLDLYPVGKTGPLVTITCGSSSVAVQGSFILPVTADKMLMTVTEHAVVAKGKQNPDSFLGEPLASLEESLNGGAYEQAGVTFTTVQTNEEPVEINTVL